MKWQLVEDEYDMTVKQILTKIDYELRDGFRKEGYEKKTTPFYDHKAEEFKTDSFTLRPWTGRKNSKPNFETEYLRVWWRRNMYQGEALLVCIPENSDLATVLKCEQKKCIESIHKYFENQWVKLASKYDFTVRAFLNMIDSELRRCHWNSNQKELDTPFENTGIGSITTGYCTIRSYNWNNGNELPNLETENLRIFWYKHCNRGVEAYVPSSVVTPADWLVDELSKIVHSIHVYYGENDEREKDER